MLLIGVSTVLLVSEGLSGRLILHLVRFYRRKQLVELVLLVLDIQVKLVQVLYQLFFLHEGASNELLHFFVFDLHIS